MLKESTIKLKITNMFKGSIFSFLKSKLMAKIRINDTYIKGNNIVTINGRVIVDRIDVTPDTKNIAILVDGNIESLDVAACKSIHLNGNVNNFSTVSGETTVTGDVLGDLKTTSGSIKIEGSVNRGVSSVSGSVTAGEIKGSISTVSGSIKTKIR